MSVSFNQYLMLGIKRPIEKGTLYEVYEDYIDNGYKPDIIHKNGLSCIYDGMDGKYIILGRIIQKSRLNQPLDGVFTIDPVDVERAELIAGLINLSFPMVPVHFSEMKFWFVTHYH